MERIAWEEEHKEYKHLLKYRNKHEFGVPAGYFEKKEHALEMMLYPQLLSQGKDNKFSVPDDYFHSFSVQFENEAEFTNTSGILGSLQKQNSFVVEVDYFRKNEEALREKLLPPGNGRIIRLLPNRLLYPAAAALLIAIGLWSYSYYFTIEVPGDCSTMACIDKKDLKNSGNLESLDEEQLYEIVNTKELESKLEGSGNMIKEDKRDSNSKSISVDDLLDEI